MNHARILIAALALFLSLHATAANINILYVSPTSTGNGAGTLEDTFSTISAAYGAACQSNTQITIKLLPGVYTESGTLLLTTNKIILEGCGPDQSVIQSLLVFVSNEPCALANLSIKCVFTNTAMAYLHNVQLPFALSGYTNIVGMWRENMGNGDEIRIQGLAEPVNPSDAVTLSFIQYLTNHLDASSIKTGTIAAERIATSIARVSELEATSNHLAGIIRANITAVSNHANLSHLKWSEAGHTIDANMVPSADSMYSSGTNGARWLQVNSVVASAQTNNIARVAFIGPFTTTTTNAYDISSVTNNGFVFNAPLYENGKIGKSWDMQGYPGHGGSALNFVYSTDVSAYDCFSGKNNFSVNMWVKYHSFSDLSSWWQTALCGQDFGYYSKWIWSIDGPTKKFVFHYWGNQQPVLESAAMTIDLETWYMFTITRNGTSDDYKFYQNGSLISTVNNSGSITNDPGYLYMGFAEGGVSIDASLDEVTLWSNVLDQTAIATLYNSGSGSQVNGTESCLVGAYTFDNSLTPGTDLPKTDDKLQIDGSAFVHGRVKGHPGIATNEFVIKGQMDTAINSLQMNIAAVSNIAIAGATVAGVNDATNALQMNITSVTNGLGSGTITAVTASGPLSSSGGATPDISLSGQIGPTHIADSAVSATKIQDGAVTVNKLATIAGSLLLSASAEQCTPTNLSLQVDEYGMAVLWYPVDGAFVVKSQATGWSGTRFIVRDSDICAYRTLDMVANRITHVGAPQDAADAVNRGYVDVLSNTYLKVSGGTMAGELATPALTITGTNNWYVGNNSATVDLVMVSNGGEIKSQFDLRLRAPNGEIQFNSPVKFNAGINEAGRAGQAKNIVTTNGYQISVPSCTTNSIVLITPIVNSSPLRFWVQCTNGSFAVWSAESESNAWSFNYLVR